MEETTRAYLAGLIDADGHISIHYNKQQDYYYLRVGISNRSEDLLFQLQRKMGMGKIYLNEKQTSKRNAVYSLLVHGRQAARLLDETIEYLILKKEQARIGLEFAKLIKKPAVEIGNEELEKRATLYRRIKLLNKRGRSNPKFKNLTTIDLRRKKELVIWTRLGG